MAEEARAALVAKAVELIQQHGGSMTKGLLGIRLKAASYASYTRFTTAFGKWHLILGDPRFSVVPHGDDPIVRLVKGTHATLPSAAAAAAASAMDSRAALVQLAAAILQENSGRYHKGTLGSELKRRRPSEFAAFTALNRKWDAILEDPRFKEIVFTNGTAEVNLVQPQGVAPPPPPAQAPASPNLPRYADPGGTHPAIALPMPASAFASAGGSGAASTGGDLGAVVVQVGGMSGWQHSAMLRHLAACNEVAVDAEWAGEQLCLVQIFVPGIPLEGSQPDEGLWSHEPTAYLVDLVAAGASGGPDLLASLAPMLTDPCKLKVLHDCREDVARLSRACGGVRIAPVLDTQVAHALQQLAALGLQKTEGAPANAPSGTSPSVTASDPGPSSSMAAGAAGAEAATAQAAAVRPVGLARTGLGRLLELHGLPHPEKEAMATGMRKDPGSYVTMWRTRPLPPHVIQYAAGDVVHLLRVARAQGALDSRLARALSQLQADLYQCPPGPSSDGLLAVDPAVVSALARYFKQGTTGEGAPTTASAALGAAATATTTGSSLSTRVAPHTPIPHAPLELELLLGPGPRYAPSFRLYTRDAAPPAEQQQVSSSATAGAGSTGVWKQQEQESNDTTGPALDEDAATVVALMPPGVLPHLLPYLSIRSPDEASSEGSGSGVGGSSSSDSKGASSALMEVTIDEGKPVTVMLRDGSKVRLPVKISTPEAVSLLMRAKKEGYKWQPDLAVLKAAAAGVDVQQEETEEEEENPLAYPFASDGRMGLPGTLHRISGMRDREGRVHALTYRIGRHMPGVARAFTDLLAAMRDAHSVPHPDPDDPLWTPSASSSSKRWGGGSILLVGKPGVGKTTLLRDITRVLADDLGMGVIVVDTSNEIAGDNSQPHPCIGYARRFMVPQRDQQHAVLVEAVQNHTPDVLVVDEIGTPQEVAAAKTIAQRGVLMVGTAHGSDIHSLLKNSELNPLLGGVQAVTLGDEEARRSNAGVKTRLERAGAPVFTTLIEVLAPNRWRVHRDVAESVDILLGARAAKEAAAAAGAGGGGGAGGPSSNKHAHDVRGGPAQSLHPHAERRRYDSAGRVVVAFETATAAERALAHVQAAAGKEGEAGRVGRGGPGGAWGMDGMWLHDLWNVALLQAARGFAAGQAE